MKNHNIKFADIMQDITKLAYDAQLFLSQNNIKINFEETKLAPIHDTNTLGYPLKDDVCLNILKQCNLKEIKANEQNIYSAAGHILFSPFEFNMKAYIKTKGTLVRSFFMDNTKKWQKYMIKKYGNDYKYALIENLCSDNDEMIGYLKEEIKESEQQINKLQTANNKIINKVEELANEQELN